MDFSRAHPDCGRCSGSGRTCRDAWQPVWLMLRGWERLRVVGAEKLPTTMPTSPSANREVHIIRP